MPPIDRITLTMPAWSRLARVVQTAVHWEALQCGLPDAKVKPLMLAVLRNVRLRSARSGRSITPDLNVSLDPVRGALIVRVAGGTRAQETRFQGRAGGGKRSGASSRPRRGGGRAGRSGAGRDRRHPSV